MTALLPWIVLIGLAGSLFFSTLSYTLRMMSRVLLEQQLARWNRRKQLEDILDSRYDLALSSSVIRLLCNIAVITSTAMYFQDTSGDSHSNAIIEVRHAWEQFGLSLLLSTPALLMVSVAVPQAWARYAGEALVAGTWPVIGTAHKILYPVVYAMRLVDELIRRLAGVSLGDDPDHEAEQVEQEILAAVSEGTAGGTVDEDQKKMIEGVISFRDLQVGQIMTPRTEIIALDLNASAVEVRDKILKDGLSRVPVYEGSLDTIVGILYAKDLLATLGDATQEKLDLRKIMRPPLFVPPTKPLRDLLRELKTQQVHMAVVLDEYGGTAGLVTTEDIIEQIIGDIADEYERPEPEELHQIGERTFEVDARMNLSDLNRAVNLNLPEDQDFQTLGGFVISTLGTIPLRGERLDHEGLIITVLDSEPRRVKKLKLELPEKAEQTTDQTELAESI